MATAAGLAGCVGMIAGCGNSYRPVVATIGLVGPAGQAQKYAIAVSTPTPPGAPCPAAGQPTSNGLMSMVDFSGDTVLVTATLGVNPYYLYVNPVGTVGYTLNCDKTVNTFTLTTTLLSSQVLQSTLPVGTNPVSLLANSSSVYVSDPGVNAIDVLFGTPPALKQELPVTNGYTPIYVTGQASAPRLYAISQANNGGPGEAQSIETNADTISATLPVGRGPVYGVMTSDNRRAFVLNHTDGTVTVINAQTDMLDTPVNTIPVGCMPTGGATTCPASRPVWADLAPGLNELAVANEGPTAPLFGVTGYSIASNVLTVSTASQNLVAGQPVLLQGFPASTFLNGQVVQVSATGLSGTSFQAPLVHANAATIEMGQGAAVGSVTLINIPLCSVTALPTNPNCNPTNPIDGAAFGQIVATVPAGVDPIMVTVLSDYTRAYVANAGTGKFPCSGTTAPVFNSSGVQTAEPCTVSVVNLLSDTVTATIPINGHPAYIASTDSVPTGKVYVVCKDSEVMTIIRTDTDAFYMNVPLQGYGVSVRTNVP
jgi:YVTN family beta-propeller protein